MTKENAITVPTPTRLSDLMTGPLPYQLTNDCLFHIIIQKEPKILKSLLCSLLDLSPKEIIDIHLENPIYPGDYMDDKEIVLDVTLTLNYNRKINIELQIADNKDWPERSLFYLCTSFADLKEGYSYKKLKPSMHIGILNYTLFKEHPKFYAKFLFKEVEDNTIYSDKLALNVLCLSQIDLATKEDIASGRWLWAKLLKAETWEEVKKLTKDDELLDELSELMARVMSDDKLRYRFRARRMYEMDRRSEQERKEEEEREREQAVAESLAKGMAEGLAEGKAEGLAEGKAKGLAEGKAEGLAEGKAEGLAEGKAEGLAEGKAEGLAEGKAKGKNEGQNKMLSLVQKMTANDEGELLSKLSDPEFLEEMYRKYQIVDIEK